MTTIPLKFQVGARTIAKVDRMLTRVALSLDDAIEGAAPVLPPLAGDGYLITSLPEPRLEQLTRDGLIGFVRQRYTRYWTDLAAGYDQWFAGLSGNARSMVKRKTKRLVQSSGGALDVREYHGANALAEFYPLARALSAKTYQERLLGSGLPTDAASVQHLYALAAVDRVRAWLLFIEGTPIAYLCCTADGETLIYNHVGHDPSQNELSPGTVLQAEAMRRLFDDRFARFDFTEGEGQHKRLFATDGVACVDLLLLRPTLANRAAVTALGAFDGAMALAKRAAMHPALARIARKVRR